MRSICAALLVTFSAAGCAANSEPLPPAATTPGMNTTPIAQVATVTLADAAHVRLVPVGGTGWARTSVNSPIFRTDSLVTFKTTQYIAFYDGDGSIVLGKRKLGTTTWELQKTAYTGKVEDAHNAISLGVDGKGVLHLAWALHNQPLQYARSTAPGSLTLSTLQPMTGDHEDKVTYPQFYALPEGDLLFAYRDGASGDGDELLDRYDTKVGQWKAVQRPLIDGQNQRNAYVNRMAVDSKGGLHLSWCWRETFNVETNHDICYAYSPDGGVTWQKTTGEKYALPITAQTAEIASPVPQKSELINQTSMTVDAQGRPVIATYWRAPGSEVPQYQVVWYDGKTWHTSQATALTKAFRLNGGGTKKIPISRPIILAGKTGALHVVFRSEELGNGIYVATSTDAAHQKWTTSALSRAKVGDWEPTYDAGEWQRAHTLYLFLQNMGQGDGEGQEDVPPQPISVLEWTP